MGEHTESGFEPTPAIVRDVCDKDRPLRIPKLGNVPDKIISQPTDTVTYSRGFGDSGYRVQVVKHECPECGFERMARRIDVSPVRENEVRYWCLNPNCPHYARDELSYACHGNYPQRDKSEPVIFGD